MLIGLVSEYRGKKTAARRRLIFKRCTSELLCGAHNPFDLLVVCLPYNEDEFEKMRSTRKDSLIRKAVSYLCGYGAENIVFSKKLRDYRDKFVSDKEIHFPDGREIFYRFIPPAVRLAADRCGIRLINARVGIRAAKMDRITEYLLRELCFDIKNFTLYTEDIDTAKRLCCDFFDETGFSPAVINDNSGTCKRSDVFIDVDKKCVRVGRDILIDSVEFDFDLGNYSVNTLDIAACLQETDLSNRVMSYNCGKFILTL